MRANTLRRLRPWVQALAFILFIVVFVAAGRVSFLPADLFFRLDPLAALAEMLASRDPVPAMLGGGLVVLVLTVVAGRVWCGWLCPLGTVLDWVPAHKPAPKEADLDHRWRQVKYFLLGLILLALCGAGTYLITRGIDRGLKGVSRQFTDLASGVTGEILYVDGGTHTTAMGNSDPLPG